MISSKTQTFESPVYTFWLFSYERYNGFLGKFKSNGKNVELIIMKNMCVEREVYRIGHELKQEWGEYNTILKQWSEYTKLEIKQATMELYAMTSIPTNLCQSLWTNLDGIRLRGKTYVVRIDNDDVDILQGTYAAMYPNANIQSLDLNRCAISIKCLEVCGELFATTTDKRNGRYSRFVASWFDGSGICVDNMSFRAGKIKQLIKHSVTIDGEIKTHIMASVHWHKFYPYELGYLSPIQVYYKSNFEEPGLASFIPVQRLNSQYIAQERTIGRDSVIITIPIDRKWYL